MISADDRERDEELTEHEGEKPFARLGEEPREERLTEPDEEPDREVAEEVDAEPVEGHFEVPVEDSSGPVFGGTEEPAHAEESPYTDELADTEDPADTADLTDTEEPAAYAQGSSYTDELADTEDPADTEEPAYAQGSSYTEEPPYAEDPASTGLDNHSAEPLLAQASAEAFLSRWSEVQVAFIEDPHRSVADADALLSEILTAYQEAVEQRRAQISSDSVTDLADTEHLRLALLDYRTIITAMLPAHSS